MVDLLGNCAYAPTVGMYQRIMQELLHEGKGNAYEFFKNLDPANWANAFFQGNRYGPMCSNASESFNAWIKNERELLITVMVDAIRIKLMKLYSDRREECMKWTTEICPVIDKKPVEAIKECRG